jgi:hypothetical protein
MYFYLALILLCMNVIIYQVFPAPLKTMILPNIIAIAIFFVCKLISEKVEK